MAICRIYEVPGGTLEHYNAVNERMNDSDEPPAGSILHVAGATDDGLRVVELWESAEDIERYFERLGPALQEVGVPEPKVTEFEVHNVERNPAASV